MAGNGQNVGGRLVHLAAAEDCGEICLLAAILNRAVEDAKAGDLGAVFWLLGAPGLVSFETVERFTGLTAWHVARWPAGRGGGDAV